MSAAGLKQFDLRGATTVAEIRVALLESAARLIPQAVDLSPYPAVTRDLNLVVDETVPWAAVERTVRDVPAGRELESIEYLDTYRDAERLGTGKKSLLFSIVLRGAEGTLTSGEADQSATRSWSPAARQEHGAKLRRINEAPLSRQLISERDPRQAGNGKKHEERNQQNAKQ